MNSGTISRRAVAGLAGGLALAPARAALSGAALVIGNGGYQWETPLSNPRRDAQLVGRMLEGLGLRSETLIDADRATIQAALTRFTQRASGGQIAVLFFAGHGIQRQNNNFLVPVDADLQAGADATRQLIPVNLALQSMARARQRVLILDACRNDPLAGAGEVGLARIDDGTPGSLFCFATSPGRVALDGTGQNSPFTDALLDHLGTPGLELRQVLTRVRRRVLIATQSRQVPWDNSSLTDDVVLRDSGLPPVPRPALAAPSVSASAPAARGAAAGRGAREPSAPAPQPAAFRGGDVAFDPQLYRELPRTLALAAERRILVPEGLLVQRRDADGQETPFTGSYIRGRRGGSVVILLAYNVRSGRAVFVRATGPDQAVSEKPEWFQRDADFRDGILTLTAQGTVRRRWFLAEAGAATRNPSEMSRVGNGPGALEDLQFTRFE